MEEILADIRRKAAERNVARMAVADRFSAVATATAIDDMVALNDEFEVAESGDLPSILRADSEGTRSRHSNVQPLRPSSPLRLLDALRNVDAAEAAAADTLPVVAYEPGPTPSATPVAPSAEIAAAANDDSVKREMVSFLDTRMSRMSSPTPVVEQAWDRVDEVPSSDRPPPVEPRPLDGDTDADWAQADVPDMMGQAFALADALRDDVEQSRGAAASATVEADDAPATTLVPHAEAPVACAQEHAAELLRPMLRQWLADNMPRIVEKALHMELADSLKSGSRNS